MPLIMISGYPSSGKSTRAGQIFDYFNERISTAKSDPTSPDAERIAKFNVHLLSDESLGISRETYREARTEKQTRGEQYSAIKKFLSKDDVVIADFPNYIKGFRYQLYCESKSFFTPSCVVHIGTPADLCREWNAARPASSQYPVDILDNLIFRYEEPNGMSRWDSPLFTVPYVDEQPDLEGIFEACCGKEAKAKPNAATVLKPAMKEGTLHELDRKTNEVVSAVMEYQANGGEGGRLSIDGAETNLQLPPGKVTLPQLQRLRRQFVNLNRQHAVSEDRVKELFVVYINESLN